jgi:hypothetical protein
VESFEFRVFPTGEPPRLGTVFDMDMTPYPASGEREREVSSLSGGYVLIKANEGVT